MNTMSKKYVSPTGIALSPHLQQPDTKFTSDGIYSVKLKLTGEDAKLFAEFLDSKMNESFKEAKVKHKGVIIKRADPPYSWDDSGDLIVSFRSKASGVTKEGRAWVRKPALFNDDLTPHESIEEVTAGTKVVVSYTPASFFTQMIGAGISLRLEAIQLLDPPSPAFVAMKFGFTKGKPQPTPPIIERVKNYVGNLIGIPNE